MPMWGLAGVNWGASPKLYQFDLCYVGDLGLARSTASRRVDRDKGR
jgi:hypothetical protein